MGACGVVGQLVIVSSSFAKDSQLVLNLHIYE